MAAEKISVTIDAADLQWARETAANRSVSLSSFLTQALRAQRQAEARAELVAEARKPVTPEAIAKVMSEWQD